LSCVVCSHWQVKSHVQRINELIQDGKQKELAEAAQVAQMAILEQIPSAPIQLEYEHYSSMAMPVPCAAPSMPSMPMPSSAPPMSKSMMSAQPRKSAGRAVQLPTVKKPSAPPVAGSSSTAVVSQTATKAPQ